MTSYFSAAAPVAAVVPTCLCVDVVWAVASRKHSSPFILVTVCVPLYALCPRVRPPALSSTLDFFLDALNHANSIQHLQHNRAPPQVMQKRRRDTRRVHHPKRMKKPLWWSDSSLFHSDHPSERLVYCLHVMSRHGLTCLRSSYLATHLISCQMMGSHPIKSDVISCHVAPPLLMSYHVKT